MSGEDELKGTKTPFKPAHLKKILDIKKVF